MSIKRNPREMQLVEVDTEFTDAFLALEQKYKLTYGEMFELLGKRLLILSRHLVIDERGK